MVHLKSKKKTIYQLSLSCNCCLTIDPHCSFIYEKKTQQQHTQFCPTHTFCCKVKRSKIKQKCQICQNFPLGPLRFFFLFERHINSQDSFIVAIDLIQHILEKEMMRCLDSKMKRPVLRTCITLKTLLRIQFQVTDHAKLLNLT